jgi:hypothetical protein
VKAKGFSLTAEPAKNKAYHDENSQVYAAEISITDRFFFAGPRDADFERILNTPFYISSTYQIKYLDNFCARV